MKEYYTYQECWEKCWHERSKFESILSSFLVAVFERGISSYFNHHLFIPLGCICSPTCMYREPISIPSYPSQLFLLPFLNLPLIIPLAPPSTISLCSYLVPIHSFGHFIIFEVDIISRPSWTAALLIRLAWPSRFLLYQMSVTVLSHTCIIVNEPIHLSNRSLYYTK